MEGMVRGPIDRYMVDDFFKITFITGGSDIRWREFDTKGLRVFFIAFRIYN